MCTVLTFILGLEFDLIEGDFIERPVIRGVRIVPFHGDTGAKYRSRAFLYVHSWSLIERAFLHEARGEAQHAVNTCFAARPGLFRYNNAKQLYAKVAYLCPSFRMRLFAGRSR